MIRARRFAANYTGGFTLLEVLLALVLSAALLAGLWAALEISLRMFESGRTRVEEAQLTRALLHQLDRDLRDVVGPIGLPATGVVLAGPVRQESPGESGSSHPSPDSTNHLSRGSRAEDQPVVPAASQNRRSKQGWSNSRGLPQKRRPPGLFGSSHELRIDVCRVVEKRASMLVDRVDVAPEAAELRTIYYLLARHRPVEQHELGAPSYQGDGLVRYETAWLDSPLEETAANIRATEATTQDRLFEEFLFLEDQFEQSETDSIEAPVKDAVATDLAISPEVLGLEFRYFDGAEWLSSWDSEAQGTLPAAVELVLMLKPPHDKHGPRDVEPQDRLHETPELQPMFPSARLITQLPLGNPIGSDEPSPLTTRDDGSNSGSQE